MRTGFTPTRINYRIRKLLSDVTVGLLNYIPNFDGYFAEQFQVLKLSIASLRANSQRPFDLIVVDNDSCQEVKDWLLAEHQAKRIDHLILNRHNLGKCNCMMQIQGAALGDFVFYADADYFYHPGWMQPHLDIMREFPEAGVVSAGPNRINSLHVIEKTREWARANAKELNLKVGNFVPEEWTMNFLLGLGQTKLGRFAEYEDWQVSRNGVVAYLGSAHSQFCIRRAAINSIPRRRFTMALSDPDDKYIDESMEKAGWVRLCTSEPKVYHMGNSMPEPWVKAEYERLVG